MNDLFSKIECGCSLTVNGSVHEVVGKAIYVTETSPSDAYYKVFFKDQYVLVLAPSDNFACFGIDVGDCGVELGVPSFTYEGVSYDLGETDYQIPVQVDKDSVLTSEGEVRFWDYEASDDEGKLISVTVVSKTGLRSDIVAECVDPAAISL